MKLDPLVVEIGLADEEIGIARYVDQRLGPFGIAGVGDRTTSVIDAERIWWCTTEVPHLKGRDPDAGVDFGRSIWRKLQISYCKLPRSLRGLGEQDLHGLSDPHLDPGRPGNRELPLPVRKLSIRVAGTGARRSGRHGGG